MTTIALVALFVAVLALTLAVVVMRQNATTTRDLRRHRAAHNRTHGRHDPDPEHHGTSPTVTRLVRDVEELAAYVAELSEWAEGADRRLPPRPGRHEPPPTEAMPAARRPEARP